MKALIVINESDSQDVHKMAAKAEKYLRGRYETKLMKVSEDGGFPLQNTIGVYAPDYLVTYNLAGFDLRLIGGDLFYNSLGCRASHVLTDPVESYGDRLSVRVNMDWEYVIARAEDEAPLKKRLGNIITGVRVLENNAFL